METELLYEEARPEKSAEAKAPRMNSEKRKLNEQTALNMK
jgi:hypothetical protein